ncbi:MAG: DinB family protein [Actinomycetota bacterium]|nr:DinB family protein [Actinomycetota bacterium]
MATMTAGAARGLSGERAALLETLAKHRMLFRYTVAGIGEDEARRRTTVSALTLGGLLKHVVEVEEGWFEFVQTGRVRGSEEWAKYTPEAIADGTTPGREDMTLGDGESVAGWLARWDEVAARTDAYVAEGDLDVSHPLPDAPWNPPGKWWSARQVFAHVIGETAQHSGHADIIRESLDGQRTMG